MPRSRSARARPSCHLLPAREAAFHTLLVNVVRKKYAAFAIHNIIRFCAQPSRASTSFTEWFGKPTDADEPAEEDALPLHHTRPVCPPGMRAGWHAMTGDADDDDAMEIHTSHVIARPRMHE